MEVRVPRTMASRWQFLVAIPADHSRRDGQRNHNRAARIVWLGTVMAASLLAGTGLSDWGKPTRAWGAVPKLNSVFPPGAARGQKVTASVSGEFAKWPVEFRCDRPEVTVAALADKNKVEVTVAAEAPPGVYWVRAVDGEGASSPRPIVVGTIKEVEEVEPNEQTDKGQDVELPVTINGKLGKAGDVDGYVVTLKAGERLIAAVEGNGLLGSPMDAILQVAQLTGGPQAGSTSTFPKRVEAFVLEQRDDEAGLDPRLSLIAPRDGRYLVRVFAFPLEPNSSIALSGGDNYVYRLTLATGAYVDHSLPLSRSVAAPTAAFAMIDGGAANNMNLPPLELTAPVAGEEALAADDRTASWAFHPTAPGAFYVPWTDLPSLVATDAAVTAEGQAIAVPAVVSGRLTQARQRATFRFMATKGQALQVKVDARSFGSALDPHLAVRDAMGKVLSEVDDAKNMRDASLNFTAPADGTYDVVVRDVHLHGSSRHSYRLTIAPTTPDYGLTVASDALVLTAGKPLEIPVTIDRRDGFKETIELQVEGLPTGVTVMPAKSEPKGDSAKTVKLTVQADPAMLSGIAHTTIRIVGVSGEMNAKRHRATFTVTGSPVTHRNIWLTVIKP